MSVIRCPLRRKHGAWSRELEVGDRKLLGTRHRGMKRGWGETARRGLEVRGPKSEDKYDYAPKRLPMASTEARPPKEQNLGQIIYFLLYALCSMLYA